MFKWPSMQRIQCPIHNGTLETVIWAIIWKISSFFWVYKFLNFMWRYCCYSRFKVCNCIRNNKTLVCLLSRTKNEPPASEDPGVLRHLATPSMHGNPRVSSGIFEFRKQPWLMIDIFRMLKLFILCFCFLQPQMVSTKFLLVETADTEVHKKMD